MNESDILTTKNGWQYDGSGKPVFYGTDTGKRGLFRLYNISMAAIASHHYTADKNEADILVKEHGYTYDNNGEALFYLQ